MLLAHLIPYQLVEALDSAAKRARRVLEEASARLAETLERVASSVEAAHVARRVEREVEGAVMLRYASIERVAAELLMRGFTIEGYEHEEYEAVAREAIVLMKAKGDRTIVVELHRRLVTVTPFEYAEWRTKPSAWAWE